MFAACVAASTLLALPASRPVGRAQEQDTGSDVITTIAGGTGLGLDGGPATYTTMHPTDIAVDSTGNLFVADGNRIRKVTSDGLVYTVAGNDQRGYGGDGGPALSATLNVPTGIAIDSDNNLLIADCYNNRVRKVSADGTISTIAGTGSAGFAGDGGQATAAQLYCPADIAADRNGNVLIADQLNNRIRRVTPGGVISTVAGNGTQGFNGDAISATTAQLFTPSSITFDLDGNLIIVDSGNQRIRKVNSAGIISTIAGTGTTGFNGDSIPAASALLNSPTRATIDGTGNFLITDNLNCRIRKINAAGIISTIAGTGSCGFSGDNGPATSAQLYNPGSLAFAPNGNLLIADYSNLRIRRIRPATPGAPLTTTVSPNSADQGTTVFATIVGTNLAGATNVRFSGTGVSATIANNGTDARLPIVISIDPVAATGTRTVFVTTPNGISDPLIGFTVTLPGDGIIETIAGTGTPGFSGDGGAAINAQMDGPASVAVDASGNIFIADYYNHRVRRVTPDGRMTTVAGNGTLGFSGDGGFAASAMLSYPTDVAVDRLGNLFIADAQNQRIRKVDSSGMISTVAGSGTSGFSGDGGAATTASLNYPTGVAVDAAGNLFIADSGNNRIRQVNAAGKISSAAGNGTMGFAGDGGAASAARLSNPGRVAINGAGDLFFVDSGNKRVRKVNSMGIITTVAGSGAGPTGPSTDGLPAVSQTLANPTAIAFDVKDNLVVCDTGSGRIRRVDSSGIMRTIVGNPAGSNYSSTDGTRTTAVELYLPGGLAIDAMGNIFLIENNRIRRITRDGPAFPAITAISVTSGTQAATTPAIITGYNLRNVNAVLFSGSGVTATIGDQVTDSQIPVTISIASNASAGIRTLTLTTATRRSLPFTGFTVNNPFAPLAPAIGRYIDGTPKISRLSAPQGTKIAVTIMGTSLDGATAVTFSGTGVTATILSGGSSGAIPVMISVDADAAIGVRSFTVTTGAGTSNPVSGFSIIPSVNGSATFTLVRGEIGVAVLNQANGLTVDPAGNIFIADTNNHRIRKISPIGAVTTVAGIASVYGGFSGDGGPATSAALNYPRDVAIDSHGNLYIADWSNLRIRKVDTAGIITTVAGDGSVGTGGDGGPARSAQLTFPGSIAIDAADNLYISDFNRVRMVDAAGVIRTIAGTTGGFSGDGGPATLAQLSYVAGITFDGAGNLFIADGNNNRIRMVNRAGTISTIAGNGAQASGGDGGPAASAQLFRPYEVAADSSGNLYVLETANSIRVINAAGTINTVPLSATLGLPQGLATDLADNVFISDTGNNRILELTRFPQPVPAITTITPASGLAGTSVLATITGTNLVGATAVTFSGTGVAATILGGGTKTSIPISITIDPEASPGLRTLSVTTRYNVSAIFSGFTINPTNVPRPTNVNPISAAQGAAISATITGVNLSGATAVSFSGSGIVASVVSGGTSTSLPVTITVDPLADFGPRTLTVTTPNGTSSTFNGFVITPSVPLVSAISAIDGVQGTTIQATITGSNLSTVTTVNFSGIGVAATISGSRTDTTLPVTITIARNAATGLRSLVVSTPFSLSNQLSFTVDETALAYITAFNPGVGLRGTTQPAVIIGTHLSGVTTVTFTGTGVTADMLSGGTDNNLPVSLSIATGVATGSRSLRVTSAAGTTDFPDALGIQEGNPIRITAMSPSAARQGTNFSATLMGRNLDGASAITFSGVGVSAVISTATVITSTSIQINGTVAMGASLGIHTITVSTPAGSADAFNGLKVLSTLRPSIIETVVGNGNPGYRGDGTIQGLLNNPGGIASDASGNVFVADRNNNRIRKITNNGVFTVAGTGVAGYNGDNRSAVSALLTTPGNVAVDAAGNLFIADTGNQRVRKVTPAGVISTVAGTGTRGYSGDEGPANSAQLDSPTGLAITAAGNLLIADKGNHCIRSVDASGFIRTVVGTGFPGFSGDGGPASSARFNSPTGIAMNGDTLYIADTANNRLRRVSASNVVTTVAGSGVLGFGGDGADATTARLYAPTYVAIDVTGNVIFADSGNNRIRKVTPAGLISTIAGNGATGYSGDSGLAVAFPLTSPLGLALGPDGVLFVVDNGNNSIRVVDSSGSILTRAGPSMIYGAADVVLDSAGNLFIADSGNNRIRKVSPNGLITSVAGNGMQGFSGDGGLATAAQLADPGSIAIDGTGNLFIADKGNHRIRKVNTAGIITTIAGNGGTGSDGDGGPAVSAQITPRAVIIDSSGNLLISDTNNNRIRKVTAAGIITTIAGNGTAGFNGDGGPAASAMVNSPAKIELDQSGNLYIADSGNARIRIVNPSGVINTIVGTGTQDFDGDDGPATAAQFNSPQDMVFDAAGNLFIADTQNLRVRMADPAGIVTTVAGGGTSNPGDGGPATSAVVFPSALTVDGAGNVFVTDINRIRRVSFPAADGQPAITAITPFFAYPGDTLDVTVSGSNLTGASAVTFSGTGITATIVGTANDTSFNATLHVASDASVGPRTVSVAAAAGMSTPFRSFNVASPFRLPGITGVSPASGVVGTTFAATITGTDLAGVTSVVFGGTGITATVMSGGTATSVPLTVTVDAGAALGVHTISATTPVGTSPAFSPFTVVKPTITSIFPQRGSTGTIQTAVISGSTLLGTTTVTFSGTGITGVITSNRNDSSVAFTLTIDPEAVPGLRSFVVSTPFASSQTFTGFTVLAASPDGVISTVAGSGDDVDADGVPATSTSLFVPTGLSLDTSGNIFIADLDHNRIRKVTTDGMISTVAGDGSGSFSSGDNGPATAAHLSSPLDVAVDQTGSLYIVESVYVRKVGPDGIIRRYAGSLTNLLGDGGPASSASVNNPTAVSVDAAGNVYIADTENNRIRKVTTDGIINTIGGNGLSGYSGDGGPATSARLNLPEKIAIDAAGNVFIADTQNQRIRKIDSAGIISTIAGTGNSGYSGDGGPATSAQLNIPVAVTVDGFGNLFIADAGNHRIRKISPSGIISTAAGTGFWGFNGDGGSPAAATLNDPIDVDTDVNGNIYIVDSGNNRVRKVTRLPAVAGISPASANQASSFSAMINGTALFGATAMTFSGTGITASILGGGTATSLPVSINVAADAAPGIRAFTITTAAGLTRFRGFTVVSIVPTITGISPGFVAAGTTVSTMINGTNFSGATAVTFSGTGITAAILGGGSSTNLPVTITIDSDASIGVRSFTVTTGGGISAPFDGINVLPPGSPTINELSSSVPGLSQTVAPYYGRPFELTVNGTGFMTDATLVLGSTNLQATIASSNRLTAIVPTGAVSVLGILNIHVVNPGNLVSNDVTLKVGRHGDINANGLINIGDALVEALTVGGVLRPPLPVSVGDLNLNGAANISDALTLALFAGRAIPDWPVPRVSSVSPSTVSPGGSITISGSGFATSPSDNTVLLSTSSGMTALVPSSSSSTSLTVTLPDTATSGSLQVYRMDSPLAGREVQITVSGTPGVVGLSDVTPSYQLQPGATLVLTGVGFDATASNNTVSFKSASGTVSAQISSASTTSLTVTVPLEAVCGPVAVSTGGHSSNPRMVTIAGTACNLQLSGVVGRGAPGETLVLEGAGFDSSNPGNNIVRFTVSDGTTVAAPVLAVGTTLLHVHIPETAVQGDLIVSVGNTISNTVTYQPPVH